MSEHMTPVMYVDPDGESALLIMIAICAVTFAFGLYVTNEPVDNPGENFSASASGTGNPGFGAEFIGFGAGYGVGITTYSVDFDGNLNTTISDTIQVGPFGGTRTYNGDGSITNTISFFFFYTTYEEGNFEESLGGGVSGSTSLWTPVGGGGISFDFGMFTLIKNGTRD